MNVATKTCRLIARGPGGALAAMLLVLAGTPVAWGQHGGGGGHSGGGGGHSSAGGGHASGGGGRISSGGGGHVASAGHSGAVHVENGHTVAGGHGFSSGSHATATGGHAGGAGAIGHASSIGHAGGGQFARPSFAATVHAAPHTLAAPAHGVVGYGSTHGGVSGLSGLGHQDGFIGHGFTQPGHHIDDHHFFGFDHHYGSGLFLGLGFGAVWPRYDPWYRYPYGPTTVIYPTPGTVSVVAPVDSPPSGRAVAAAMPRDERGAMPPVGGAAQGEVVPDVPLSVPLLESREAPEALPRVGVAAPKRAPDQPPRRPSQESPR